MDLNQPISAFKTVGPVYQNRLSKLNINSLKDLLYYFPFRYEDFSEQKPISLLEEGEIVTITASVWQVTKIRTKTGKSLIKAVLTDGSATLEAVWFNQDYLLTVLKVNETYNFSGKVKFFGRRLTLANPSFEGLRADKPIHTGRLVPIYSQTRGLSSKWLRSKIDVLLKNLPSIQDYLEERFLQEEQFLPLPAALHQVHFPKDLETAAQARRRLAFDELLKFQLRNLEIKKALAGLRTQSLKISEKELGIFVKSLPFELTQAQKKASEEILADLAKTTPTNRLLMGEVGSGKTVLAAIAIYVCVKSGARAALMAPTEVLARQHYQSLSKFFGKKIATVLRTGSVHLKKDESYDLIIGTHALLNESIENLKLVVIDEQQRFGVDQRAALKNKGLNPHLLTLTATPIPRTLALTLYGQLDVSWLSQLPAERKKIKTYLVPKSKRVPAYDFLRKLIKKGGQGFIICPLIEPSETLESVKSAQAEFERLSKEIFPEFKVDLIHGRQNAKTKEEVIKRFREQKTQILVATPVVEVGLDIPTADFMIIETAERFGLGSLHQLRGRIGRGTRQSYCLIFSENQDPRTLARLKLLEQFDDGVKLAEMDLKTRGPGDLFGTLQHGQVELKLADIVDMGLIEQTAKLAPQLAKNQKAKQIFDQLFQSNDLVSSQN